MTPILGIDILPSWPRFSAPCGFDGGAIGSVSCTGNVVVVVVVVDVVVVEVVVVVVVVEEVVVGGVVVVVVEVVVVADSLLNDAIVSGGLPRSRATRAPPASTTTAKSPGIAKRLTRGFLHVFQEVVSERADPVATSHTCRDPDSPVGGACDEQA